jgi:hypothetical protein
MHVETILLKANTKHTLCTVVWHRVQVCIMPGTGGIAILKNTKGELNLHITHVPVMQGSQT